VAGKNRIVLERVFVGEVWVCSGQSNMAWPVERSDGAAKELAELVNPRLFLYTVRHDVAAAPGRTAGGKWVRASPESVAKFSAVAYYFGKRLGEKLGVPVGLIHSSWGGTPAEAWTRRRTLAGNEVTAPIVTRWDAAIEAYPRKLAEWKAAVAKWEAAGSKGRKPPPPPGPGHPHRASGLYNGMIAPLVPYAIRGAIWYQGESNAGRAEQYRTLFPSMIRDWRDAWGQGDFPFYFVQLANWRAVKPEPAESDWAELREAQALALKEPSTAMAVTIDIGAAGDIHPRNKKDVGERLARPALAHLYGEKIFASGPLYDSHEAKDGRVTIRFRHAEGLRTRDDAPLKGFAIAGKDRKFRWAQARIEGDTVVLSHPDVAEPASVRYAWADNPVCNLENGAGLPASPFRTDGWPGITAGKR
jgi:sialate O-acetylesterase